jgi:hypothetical protein
MLSDGCTCFKSAPCDFCLRIASDECDVYFNGGLTALRKFRARKEMLATMTSVEQDFMKEMMERGEAVFSCATIAVVPLRITDPRTKRNEDIANPGLDFHLENRSFLFCDPNNPSQVATVFDMARPAGIRFPDSQTTTLAAILTLAGYEVLIPTFSNPLIDMIFVDYVLVSDISLSLFDPSLKQIITPVFFDDCEALLGQPLRKGVVDHLTWKQVQALDLSENGVSTGPDGLQTFSPSASMPHSPPPVKPAQRPFPRKLAARFVNYVPGPSVSGPPT